jgi:hypothetical protein
MLGPAVMMPTVRIFRCELSSKILLCSLVQPRLVLRQPCQGGREQGQTLACACRRLDLHLSVLPLTLPYLYAWNGQ